MAVYKLFPDKDNYIFTEVPQANAGNDEMIELGSYPVLEVGQTARILLHFKDISLIINIGKFKAQHLSSLRVAGCGLRVAGCASRVVGCPTAGCRTRVPFWNIILILDC